MRLGGWDRIGIVASLLWLFASSGAYFLELTNHPTSLALLLPDRLYEWVDDPESTARAHVEAIRKGQDFSNDYIFLKPTFRIQGFILFTFIPIVATWFLVHVIVAIYRWVRRGFEA